MTQKPIHLSAAIELVGSSQVTAFHLHEDGLRIDETALVEIEDVLNSIEFWTGNKVIGQVGTTKDVMETWH